MRKYITAFIQDNDLVDKMDTIPDSVSTILADNDFPVQEGKNTGAITSGFKVCYGKQTTKKKQAASTAGSIGATSVRGDGSDGEDGDNAPAPMPKGKKRRRTSSTRGTTGDEEEHEERHEQEDGNDVGFLRFVSPVVQAST